MDPLVPRRPHAGSGSLLRDGAKALLAAAAVAGLLGLALDRLGYPWQWYRVPPYLLSAAGGGIQPGPLLRGLFVTLQVSAASLGLMLAIGLATALLRLSPSLIGRATARLYLELIRNTPLLVQIFFIYFVLAPLFSLSAFASAVLALSLFEGAYASEIIRAGILSVPRGQWEAAYSLGLNTRLTYRRVILPQALRQMLPPLTGQAVSLIKDSALVSTIAVYDLTMQAQAVIAESYLVFEVWFTTAALYLALTLALSRAAARLQRKELSLTPP